MGCKKSVTAFLALLMLMLTACSEALQKEEIVERAVFLKEKEGFVCCLQGENSEIRESGDTIYACWDQALQKLQHKAALGMMSDVYAAEEISYEEIVQIAQTLQQAEIPLPAIRLYAASPQGEENSCVKGLPITAALDGRTKIFLPLPDGESGRLYEPGSSRSLSGAQAQAAMLLAGERKSVSFTLLCRAQLWRLESEAAVYTIEKEPGQMPLLRVQLLFAQGECLQDGRKMQKEENQALARQLQNQIEALLKATGIEPYGIKSKIRLQQPNAENQPIRVEVRISENL